MRVLVTGGRDFSNPGLLITALEQETDGAERVTIMTGACPTGADYYAGQWAHRNKDIVTLEEYPADWSSHGKAAGPIRNQKMVDKMPDICVAFPTGGRGTAHCIGAARKAGIPVVIMS